MIKKKCILLSLILIIVLNSICFQSFANDIQVVTTIENGVVTISGSMFGGAGKWVTVTVVNPSNRIDYLNNTIIGMDGTYSFQYKPENPVVGGTYQLRIKAEGMTIPQIEHFTYQLNTNEYHLEEIDCNISLLYDNIKYERVLLPNRALTTKLIAKNNTSQAKQVKLSIQLYQDEILENKNQAAISLTEYEEKTVSANLQIPNVLENTYVKITVEDSINSNIQYIIPITVTPDYSDYYGDEREHANKIFAGDTVKGSINNPGDFDCFSILPQKNGYYTFSTTGSTDTFGSLYDTIDRPDITYNDNQCDEDDNITDYNFKIKHYLFSGRFII